jgi:hypothetical protein
VAIKVSITSFDPLTVTWPAVDRYVGEVRIALPAVHVQVYDLSLGGILPGAHIGGDGQLFRLTVTLPEPGLTVGQMSQFIHDARATLREVWQTCQAELDKRGALLGGV